MIGGEVISQGFYDGKLKIIIVWQKPVDSMPVLIAVRRAGNNCDFLPPDRVGVVPVITPLNTVPVVTGINEYYLGEYGSTTLTASFDPLGDGVSIATNFEWEVPAEWNFFPYGPGLSNVSLYFTPQTYLTESCVRVRGQFLEGGWSEWTDYSPIGQVQIFNHLGQWVATWDDPPSKRVVKSVADLPNGLYTLRAMIRGRVITKPLAIVRLY